MTVEKKAVAPEHQRAGHGALLMRRLIEHCPNFGVDTLLGFVFAHNAASRKMLARFGFEEWGRLPTVAELDRVKRDLVILGLKLKH